MQARLLIIDDTPANLQLFCAALAQQYELQVARSGEEGIALASMDLPDLILLDVMMPGIDGFETCRRLKADPRLKDVPVIFVTALGDLAAEARGLTLGAVDYITKPINVELTRLRVRNLLEREAMRRQLQQSEAQLGQALARERLAASVFHHAQEGMIICDAENRIIDVNPTFTQMTGYSREEVLGRNPGFLGAERQDAGFYLHMWQAIVRDGYWRGEIWNRRKSGEVYAERLTISTVRDEQGRLSNYIGTFSDITQLQNRCEQLEHLAHYDPLTDLPNRLLLSDRLEQGIAQSQRAGRHMAVCFLDLDEFKPVNDRFGHETGDRLLVEVARLLKAGVRAGDTVARLGGDEFVLLLLGLESETQCRLILERLLQALNRPIAVGTLQVRVAASLGVSLLPEDGTQPEQLLRRADQAMYRAKRAGGSRIAFWHDAGQGPQDPGQVLLCS